MMKYRVFRNLLPVIFLVLLSLSSCNEDKSVTPPPVDSTYDFDSARYKWKVDTLLGDGFIGGLWAPDTNEMFIPNNFSNVLYHIKNGITTRTYYSGDNPVGVIYGDEQNHGIRVSSMKIGKIHQPVFQKWGGENFIDIPNPQNLDFNMYFWTALVKNESEIWVGTNSGRIVKFDGNKLTTYNLNDSDLVFTKIFYDEYNVLNILSYDPHYQKGNTEYINFEFRNGEFIKTYSDSLDNIMGPLRYSVLEKKIAPVGLKIIYELIDSIPVSRINVPINTFTLVLGGTSFNECLINGRTNFNGCYASLHHWNGSKWSIELCGYLADEANIFEFGGVYYAMMYDIEWSSWYVAKGVKK